MTMVAAVPGTWDSWSVRALIGVVIAHQGGWDEILFVLVPIGLFAGLLAIANRRATKAQAEQDESEPDLD
jgi:hypothetical protein